ncbi:hypothetical protein MTBSS4_60028 [Magnetospirillum sp. SS-4]|nr:hypothetical protein MTBSS4_60028 [Magnetospirillum sp. SS-4]
MRPALKGPKLRIRSGLLRGASGSQRPWGYIFLLGAVPVEALVSLHGAHLHKQATEDLQANGRGGAAPTRP